MKKMSELNQEKEAILAMSQLSIVFNRVTRVTELPELTELRSCQMSETSKEKASDGDQ